MVLNRTISSLTLAKIFNGSPFRSTQPGETLKFSKSFFSNTIKPLFSVSRGSHLSLTNSEFKNIGSSVVTMDSAITYERSYLNQTFTNSLQDVINSSIIIQYCKFDNVKIAENSNLVTISKSPTLINSNTFSDINLNKGLISITNSDINISSNVINSILSLTEPLFTITNCSGLIEDLNVTKNPKSKLIKVSKSQNITLDKIQLGYISGTGSDPIIDIEECLIIKIDSISISSSQADSTSTGIKIKNVTQASIFAAAFVNMSKPLDVSENSGVVLRRWCSNQKTADVQAENSLLLNITGTLNNSKCSYENIIIPLSTATPPLSTYEKIAMYITIVFFSLFFITTFIILISLIFCKVGMSQEIQFSEEMGEEEDSFVSFAN